MEYVIGPVITLLLAMKFTDYKSKEAEASIAATSEKIESVIEKIDKQETELPKKVMTTVIPLAKAVKTLNQTVGI
tara:strand:- start:515 stop:739 length:225 start_codon:yes stop_codon:yes gene_type:complete